MFSIYILWLLIFLLVLLLFKILNLKKNYLVCLFITVFIVLFVANLNLAMKAAVDGVKLVIVAILPTTFPFSVICNLLICYDGITLYSKVLGPLFCKPLGLSKNCSFPLSASFLCGYPLGAKYCYDSYSLGYINKKEYERLLNIATNAGPIFILGAIAISMLNDVKLGYVLLIANYLSILIIGFFTRKKAYESQVFLNQPKINNDILGTNLKKSIDDALSTTLNVGAFVVLFSVVIAIIKDNSTFAAFITLLENLVNLPKGLLYNLILGSVEFTNGCKLISISDLSIHLKLSLISFILSFSSLSVIGQVTSIISKSNPNMKKYVLYKFIQGLISFFITFICSNLLLKSYTVSTKPIGDFLNLNIIYKLFFPIFIFMIILLLFQIFYCKYKRLHSSKF
jgi:sporulation integral membrane protein YlbJ